MSSGEKFLKRKPKGRSIEVPLSHAVVATEAHLRALSMINDNEDVTDMEFTPTMVRFTITKEGGSAKT